MTGVTGQHATLCAKLIRVRVTHLRRLMTGFLIAPVTTRNPAARCLVATPTGRMPRQLLLLHVNKGPWKSKD